MIAATPPSAPPRAAPTDDTILRVEHLTKEFPIIRGLVRRQQIGAVRAVTDVSFAIGRGETLGLVGESGCGKSTTARCILRLVEPTSGRVWYWPEGAPEPVDVTTVEDGRLRRLRREMQIVFQDPYASLDPRMRVEKIIAEPLVVQGVGTPRERRDRVQELLEVVGLNREHADRFPHEFSGGQRQRIDIARALALNPALLVLDEPVSSLDVSIQAQILNLLRDLQQRFGLSYLFIAHDLSIVRHFSDRVAVMYLGRIVEMADCETLFGRPLHPYTHALLSAVPVPDPILERRRTRVIIGGELPSAADPPAGCAFHTRCPLAQLPHPCASEPPALREIEPGHWVACHLPGPPRLAPQPASAQLVGGMLRPGGA